MAQDEPASASAVAPHQLVHIGAQVPLDFREKLKDSAERNGRTVSGEIRHALRRHLRGGSQATEPTVPAAASLPVPDKFSPWAGDGSLTDGLGGAVA